MNNRIVLSRAKLLQAQHRSQAAGHAREIYKDFCGSANIQTMLPVFDHWLESDRFNVNSTDHLRRWFFEVKGLQPLKTTKKDGIQVAWDKVMAMEDPVKRAEYTPASDKQTIKVFATKDKLIAQVEELKSVGNIVKAFLKEPNPETGKEEGMHKWIQSDGRIHANFALTETDRPRAWKPNILNWPKAITKPLENSFTRVNEYLAQQKRLELSQEGFTEEQILAEVNRLMRKPVSLRSNVQAPEGFVIIDQDLKTAEIVALAYQSGDENMIKVLTEPDTQFARTDWDNDKKALRICYNENSAYPVEAQDPALVVSLDDPRLIRDKDGKILHPKRDLHWELGEFVQAMPREKCEERMARDGCGKVGNFSIPYGASPSLLERMIEVNTGKKPPEGTGVKMIEGYAARYPVAFDFLLRMEQIVEEPGYYRAITGKVRHFFVTELADVDGLSDYTRKGDRHTHEN